jgi:RNA polymerase sigma-70 factor (ECF subfamily)
MQTPLEQVVLEYSGPLKRFFQRRVRATEEVDDLVQEVFGRLARQDLATVENVQGYVFQIAANVLRDQARRANTRGFIIQRPMDFDIEDTAGFSPERVLQSRETLQALIAALYELPPGVRNVFSQYHFDGVSQVEIARRMGLSLSTVEKQMAKANAHLLKRLRKVL